MKNVCQNPLILRYHRLMDAFAKSDDERDFYLDRSEGFIVYVNLAKDQESLNSLYKELQTNADRYCLIPKLTYYEIKKIMEGFINEKVYDIDTKEKLTDIIQSKDAREHFLEFIYDHHNEFEKWQQYYQERSRIRIIEWLRNNDFDFVFEEDLELPKVVVENVKKYQFQPRAPKDVTNTRQTLKSKAKTYYSNEALNPRPKRGRPPKQIIKVEVEPEYTDDIYNTVPSCMRSFLYTPDITTASSVTFSGKFATEEEFLASLKSSARSQASLQLEALSKKLDSLRKLSNRFVIDEFDQTNENLSSEDNTILNMLQEEEDDDDDDDEIEEKVVLPEAIKKATLTKKKPAPTKKIAPKKEPAKKATTKKKAAPVKKAAPAKKKATPVKKAAPAKKKATPVKKAAPAKKKATPVKKAAPAKKKATPAKKKTTPTKAPAKTKKATKAPSKKVTKKKK